MSKFILSVKRARAIKENFKGYNENYRDLLVKMIKFMSVNYVSMNALHSNSMNELLLSACKAQPEDVEKVCS